MRASTTILWASWVGGQGVFASENKILFPTEGDLTFYYMNTIEVKYQSNFSSPILYTFCTKDGGKAEQKNKVSAPENNGTVSVTLEFTTADTCWFNLRSDDKKANLGVNSPHSWSFDYAQGEKNTTTIKAPVTASTTTTTSTSAVTTSTPAPISTTGGTVTSTPTSTPVDDDTSGKAVKIGIGIGAAIGGLLVMTVIGMVAARIVRKKQTSAGYTAPSEMTAAGASKPMSSNMSYYPVSHFEPPGATLSGPYDPYNR